MSGAVLSRLILSSPDPIHTNNENCRAVSLGLVRRSLVVSGLVTSSRVLSRLDITPRGTRTLISPRESIANWALPDAPFAAGLCLVATLDPSRQSPPTRQHCLYTYVFTRHLPSHLGQRLHLPLQPPTDLWTSDVASVRVRPPTGDNRTAC